MDGFPTVRKGCRHRVCWLGQALAGICESAPAAANHPVPFSPPSGTDAHPLPDLQWGKTQIYIYDLIFVQQTRMYSLCFIGSALILYIVEGKKNNRLAKILLVLFAGIYVLFGAGIVDAFISSFSVFGEYGAGTRVRIEAIGYYMQYLRKNPLLGMGYVHEASYKNILMGNDGRYYLSDLGIIGLMAQGGILTLCIYLLFIIRMAYIYMKLKTKSVEHLSLLAAILVFVLLTTPTLIVWSRLSMIYIGLIMAVFEYEYRTVYYDSYKKNP